MKNCRTQPARGSVLTHWSLMKGRLELVGGAVQHPLPRSAWRCVEEIQILLNGLS